MALMLVGPSKYLKQVIQTELHKVKNPSWPAIHKLSMAEDLFTGLLSTNPASGQSGTCTRGLRIASPAL